MFLLINLSKFVSPKDIKFFSPKDTLILFAQKEFETTVALKTLRTSFRLGKWKTLHMTHRF